MNAQLHAGFLEVDIETSYLRVSNTLFHCFGHVSAAVRTTTSIPTLTGNCAVERISLNEYSLPCTLSVCFEDVYGFDRVFNIAA